MPDPEKVLATVRRAITLFRATPGRSGGVVTLDPARTAEVMVVGDLHGNIPVFRQVLDVAALAEHPGRHLVLQELVHGPWMYPDDKGRPVAPARRPGLRTEVPVPRAGTPDPGQPRALGADRPLDRQERRAAQRPLPQGGRHGLWRARRGGLRRLSGAVRRAAARRADAEPRVPLPHDSRQRSISTGSTSTSSSSTPGPPRR